MVEPASAQDKPQAVRLEGATAAKMASALKKMLEGTSIEMSTLVASGGACDFVKKAASMSDAELKQVITDNSKKLRKANYIRYSGTAVMLGASIVALATIEALSITAPVAAVVMLAGMAVAGAYNVKAGELRGDNAVYKGAAALSTAERQRAKSGVRLLAKFSN